MWETYLEGLSGSQLHSLISEFIADIVHFDPLIWGSNTGRQSASDHKGVCGLKTLSLTLVSQISVILHVGSVELGELLVTSRYRTGALVLQPLDNGTAKEVRGDLDILVSNWGRFIRKPVNIIHTKGFPQLGLPL